MVVRIADAGRLTKMVAEMLDIEIESFPVEVATVFGQKLPIVGLDGSWCEDLRIEHVGYGVKKVHWGTRFHESDYVEWIARSWVIDRVQTCLDLRPATEILIRLSNLDASNDEPAEVEEILFRWLQSLAVEESATGRNAAVIGARLLYAWCLEEDLPGFSEFRLMELESIPLIRGGMDHLVSLREVISGPFTRVELGMIEAALQESRGGVTAAQRAAFLLGRDWGIRPIQMALIRPEDYGTDELGPFLMVPSVKGIRRSRRRRAKGNLVKRYIADDTAEAIEAQVAAAPEQAAIVIARVRRILGDLGFPNPDIVMPLFPARERTEDRLRRLCESAALKEYALHDDSIHLSRQIRELTWQLGIKNARALDHDGREELLQISAYRLRRTKGTGMVLSGATPEEVAEALDHQGVSSIAHYFRYNRELHDFINQVHAGSPDIEAAVQMWSGRFSDEEPAGASDITVGGLGRCNRGSPCPYHPTVTCYACQRFRPLKSADHRGALWNIEEFQRSIAGSSTGPIAQQLEAAIFGAKSVIKAIEEEQHACR